MTFNSGVKYEVFRLKHHIKAEFENGNPKQKITFTPLEF